MGALSVILGHDRQTGGANGRHGGGRKIYLPAPGGREGAAV